MVDLEDDGVIVKFGDGAGVSLTHIASNDALRINSDKKLEFRDATEFVHSDADGYLHAEGATGVNLAVNGSDVAQVTSAGLNVAGTLTGDTSLTLDTTTITTAEIGVLDGVTGGTALASKAVVLDATKSITGIDHLTASFFKGDGSALTGISSDDVDTTTDNTSNTRYIPFVENATSTDGESILIDSALSINPSTGVFTIAGSAPSLVIGSAAMVEADLEKLDGITNGTAAASKAVVLDASKNIATLGTVGCGAITSTGASSFGSISGVGAVTATGLASLDGGIDVNGNVTVSAAGVIAGATSIDGSGDLTMGTITMTGFGVDADGDAYAKSATLTQLTAGRLPLVSTSKKLVSN